LDLHTVQAVDQLFDQLFATSRKSDQKFEKGVGIFLKTLRVVYNNYEYDFMLLLKPMFVYYMCGYLYVSNMTCM